MIASTQANAAQGWSLVNELLAEQQSLSAVDQFSRQASAHTSAKSYRALLPATPPGPGQQYAFEVDLDRCSGCKACVTACHSLNGLDEGETWREVGLLVGGPRSLPVLQHVTTACHHCLEPACMHGCPVRAYEKDPVTGIVKHLDDQCFGCQYCTLACPYEVPKYHRGKGIVRKCDMCSSRLSVGEPPACVQACPHEAIVIRLVDRDQVIEDAETAVFLPAAPDPQLTYPTTTYKSRTPFPRNLLPADYYRVSAQHAHWPLVIMLVLTQLSVGAFVIGAALARWLPEGGETLERVHASSALGFGLLALAASTFHLGRPFYAYRAVLGLRRSWLSREIVAFGLFAKLACALAAVLWLAPRGSWLASQATSLSYAVGASGLLGVFCSAMIYVWTGRECWSPVRVGLKFLLTSAWLGAAALWLSLLLAALVSPNAELTALNEHLGRLLAQGIVVVAAFKLCWEAGIFAHLPSRRMTALRRSAMLMAGELSGVTLARFSAGVLGGLFAPLMLLNTNAAETNLPRFAVLVGALFVASLAGELLERKLFFAACAAPRMPGGMR
jgi:Fe-S-cluster-containing dehydrogenase component/DMSO reductase anchor subunit